uniref:dUTPase-like domain-containing protein n=1 Tax=Anser cygnoides TaxID=8845 RepID=A0A8B9IDU2_ANSCY
MGTELSLDPRSQARLNDAILRQSASLCRGPRWRAGRPRGSHRPGHGDRRAATAAARCSSAPARCVTAESPTAKTRGSAGPDVSTATSCTLWDARVRKMPLNVKGPVGKGCSALLLGRASTTLTGLFVLPGVIDAGYEGIRRAMAWTPPPPMLIPKGTRIAQLILFEAIVPQAEMRDRHDAGFGSTGPPSNLPKNSYNWDTLPPHTTSHWN